MGMGMGMVPMGNAAVLHDLELELRRAPHLKQYTQRPIIMTAVSLTYSCTHLAFISKGSFLNISIES